MPLITICRVLNCPDKVLDYACVSHPFQIVVKKFLLKCGYVEKEIIISRKKIGHR